MKHIDAMRSVSEMVVFSECNWLNWTTSLWWWLHWQHVVKIKSGVRDGAGASGRRTTTVTEMMTAEAARTSQKTAVSDRSVFYSAVYLQINVRRQCTWHCWAELQRLLSNPNTLVATSKGMRAVKLCIYKIRQFLSEGAGQSRLTCIMAVKRWLCVVCLRRDKIAAVKLHAPSVNSFAQFVMNGKKTGRCLALSARSKALTTQPPVIVNNHKTYLFGLGRDTDMVRRHRYSVALFNV